MIIGFLISTLVTAVSLWIISKLPTGIEVDSFGKAFIAGLIYGLLNSAIIRTLLFVLTLPLTIVTLGIFWLLFTPFLFGLTAALVDGFRLRWGILSAIIGAIALSIVNTILFALLNAFGIAVQ